MDSPKKYSVLADQPESFLAQMPDFRETSLGDHHLVRAAKILLHRAEGLKKITDIHVPTPELEPQPIKAMINNAVHVVLGYLEMLEEDGDFSEVFKSLSEALANLQGKIEECSQAVETAETGSDLSSEVSQAKRLLVELGSFFGDQMMLPRSPSFFVISTDPEATAALDRFYGLRTADAIAREAHFYLSLSLKNLEGENDSQKAELDLLAKMQYARERLNMIMQQLVRSSVDRAVGRRS